MGPEREGGILTVEIEFVSKARVHALGKVRRIVGLLGQVGPGDVRRRYAGDSQAALGFLDVGLAGFEEVSG